jgi:hypothetical protein
LPPTHDLESISLWLSLAREVDVPFDGTRERLVITGNDGTALRFDVPKVALTASAVQGLNWEP